MSLLGMMLARGPDSFERKLAQNADKLGFLLGVCNLDLW